MTSKQSLSVVLATRNEEVNLAHCLASVRGIADEIIVFDEYSTDDTRKIARKYGAKVYKYKHKTNFHETKQKAIEKAKSDWILQLDADERLTHALQEEIKTVINLDLNIKRHPEYVSKSIIVPTQAWKNRKTGKLKRLFLRHQNLIKKREGKLGKKTSEVVAFFFARKNFFLGKPLQYSGAYPDGVIRLFRKGKARLPAKSVHELMEIDGEVGWLFNHLEHYDTPSIDRYFLRMGRYTNLHAESLRTEEVGKNIFQLLNYSYKKPITTFIKLFFRHKGYKDGWRGYLWAVFSAMHFPVAYFKYWKMKNN